jgi:hypothetical protein
MLLPAPDPKVIWRSLSRRCDKEKLALAEGKKNEKHSEERIKAYLRSK